MAKMPVALMAMMVGSLLMGSGVLEARAQDPFSRLAGRKFTINNVTPFDGTPACPSANPNTVAFYPSSGNKLNGTVKIVGQFNAASIGVCENSFYSVPSTTIIRYEVYADWVAFRVPGYVSTALRLFIQQPGNLLASVSIGNEFYLSILTDAGAAN